MSRRLPLAALLLLGCAQAKIQESNKKWADGVVVASSMCARDRTVQHSNDREGQRIWCGFEEMLGSHIPKCVCRDEMRFDEERALAQEYQRQAAAEALQPGSSVDASMNRVPSRSGSNH